MLTERQIQRELEMDLVDVSQGACFVGARHLWRAELDALRASEDISTHQVAVQSRVLLADGGAEVPYRHDLTPHLKEVHDACDDPRFRVVALKGPARSGKTIAFENYLLKIGMYGPSRNMLWYMDSEPQVRRYVDERVDFFLRRHPNLWSKRDRTKAPKWNLRRVDGGLWEWLPANKSTTRARSASLIVGDEIDAMDPKVRDAIVTLFKNRQREYGSLAKILVASHPDAGPSFGIDHILEDSDLRVRMAVCCHCGHRVGAAQEVEKARRLVWNMAELMKRADEMTRDELLDFIAERIRLICPFCQEEIDNDQRLKMRFSAEWMGKGQFVNAREEIDGELTPKDTAGFVFHAIDAPFDSIAALARPWAEAFLVKKETGSSIGLKEVTVKTLGETYLEDEAGARPAAWKEVKARLVDSGYAMGTVPRGVDFIVAMVDVQGDRFEPGYIGWSRFGESWLIDRYAAKQLEGFSDISPGERLSDWDVLETIMRQTYPLNDGTGRVLGVAKLCVDTGGVPGVTDNARKWMANLMSRPINPVPPWRVALLKGAKELEGELIGRPRKIETDAAGRPLTVPIVERTTNTTELKKIIAYRREIEEPGPLRMHLPVDVTDTMVRQLCAETLVNGLWIARGHNELWDIWVGAEVGRQLLAPDNKKIDWENSRPIWAQPFNPSQDGRKDGMAAVEQDFFDRLKRFNRRRAERR